MRILSEKHPVNRFSQAYPKLLQLAIILTVALAILAGSLLASPAAQAQDPVPPTPTPIPTGEQQGQEDGSTAPGPRSTPTLTIAPYNSRVNEGSRVDFIITASSAPSSNLDIYVSITETGDFLTGTIPDYITMAGGDTTVWLILFTDDDTVGEPDGGVTAEILSRSTYSLGTPYNETILVDDTDPAPPTSLSLSIEAGDDNDLDLAYTRSESPHYYQFQLHRSGTENGTYTLINTVSDSLSPANFDNRSHNFWFKARGRNCDNSNRTSCADWSEWSNSIFLSNLPHPTGLNLTRSDDDLSVAYTRTTSSYHYYQFQLERASSEYGSYTTYRTVNDSISPASFSNVTRDRWYRAKSRNCRNSSRTDCGAWSPASNRLNVPAQTVDLPDPPTALSLSIETNDNDDLDLAYTRSESPHYYRFELHSSTTQYGTYSNFRGVNDSSSPANFDNVTQNRWYKARGRNCQTSSRTGCGDWSPWSAPIWVNSPTTVQCETSLGTVSGTTTHTGSWTSDCDSVNRNGKYAKFISFSIGQASNVQIDLVSNTDPYLILLSGAGKNGPVLEQDDDGGDGTNSQITRQLSAGTYTIEATTYSSQATGNFTLTITGPGTLSAPAAPQGLSSSSITRTGTRLSWTSMTGADRYRVQRSLAGQNRWTTLSSSIVTHGYSAAGLTCGTSYDFQVAAYGNGTTFLSTWGPWSSSETVSTRDCNRLPAFGLSSYNFSVSEAATLNSQAGTVSATDPDTGDTLSFTITTGNNAGHFAVNSSTGAITVAGTLNHSATPSYTLTVQVSDGNGGTDTATVNISVTVSASAFGFIPSPMGLGNQSNVWTVPANTTSVYLDVDFSVGVHKDTSSGVINIQRIDSRGSVLGTHTVRRESNSGVLQNVSAGSTLRINVDNNAFDVNLALVTLTFHSGNNATGTVIARATVQKEAQPYPPNTGSASYNQANNTLTLSWSAGANRLGAAPDHFEIAIPDPNNPGTNLYSNNNVDDSQASPSLVISNASTTVGTGSFTAEVRHCNAAGGCSGQLDIPLIITATNTAFEFTPSPMGLGDQSNVWTVPANTAAVYLDVDFNPGIFKDPGAGDINVHRIDSNGSILSTHTVHQESDRGSLTGVTNGSRVRIDVDNDAFDVSLALVTLTFHSGLSVAGAEIATATVQKEAQPYPPNTGSASYNQTNNTLTLTWSAGANRLGAAPDHFEVVIPDPNNPGTNLYSNLNVDDSQTNPSLVISSASTTLGTGGGTAEVRHCNAAGGCSTPLQILFTVESQTTALATPSGLEHVNPNYEDARLWWKPVANASTYQIRYATSESGPWTIWPVALSASRITIEDTIVPGTTYLFQVRSVGQNGSSSGWSSSVEASILLGAAITSNDPYPDAGDTVILTTWVTHEGATGLSYQWQEKSDGSWIDLGISQSSNTRAVTSATAATKEYRAVTTGSSGFAVESISTFVTWNEDAISVDLIRDYNVAVDASSEYTTAQTAFLACINRSPEDGASGQVTTHTSIDGVFAEYRGAMKAKIDACDVEANMFGTIKSQTQAKLALFSEATQANLDTLNVTGLTLTKLGTYADWLRSPSGQDFKDMAVDTESIKYHLNRLAEFVAEGEGASGTSGISPSLGVGCLPEGSVVPDLAGKFAVLNCLTVQTPHDFWLTTSGDSNNADALWAKIDNGNYRYDEWLAYGGDECTKWVDGPTQACRKHDVNWSSMEIFDSTSAGHAIDKAWNPRNKYLADEIFFEDIQGNDCQESSWLGNLWCRWVTPVSRERALTMLHGVRVINNLGWSITEADIAHARTTRLFMECDIPRLTNIRVAPQGNWQYRVYWTLVEGCVSEPDIKLTFNFDYLDQEVLEGDDVYDSDYTDFSGNSWLPITIPLDERNQVEEGGGFVLESIRVDATDVEVKPLKIGDAVRGSATEVFHFFKDLYHDDVFEYTTFTLNINCTQQSDGTGTCDDPPGGGGASGEDDENDQ